MDTHSSDRQTRLSRIHPYPAMIADELAIALAKKYIRRGDKVLDPFCGTSRTLYAAAARGADCYGVDVNPLAVLISRAKSVRELSRKLSDPLPLHGRREKTLELQPSRSVRWFSRPVERELIEIVRWLNLTTLDLRSRWAVAAVLSATVREVSYCRKDQWKLHRLSGKKRRNFRPSPWKVFRRRLRVLCNYLANEETQPSDFGKVTIVEGDALHLKNTLVKHQWPSQFDVVITSPPYGDSKSTVSYGGMSSISLGVLQHLKSLKFEFKRSAEIDSKCIGGNGDANSDGPSLRRYWNGREDTRGGRNVKKYLTDLRNACCQVASVSREGTKVIFVVSRRSVHRWRVYTETYEADSIRHLGFRQVSCKRRRILGKQTPLRVNRLGTTNVQTVRTMYEEFVLVFEKCTISPARL